MSNERPRAVSTVQIDNPRLRVTLWRFAPGASTGFHRHEFDYCVVPLTTGRLRIEEGGEIMEADLTAGHPYYRNAGVEHDVINATATEFAFVDIELKEHPDTSPRPSS
ncbi:MAG: cupin domain-containing protein [Acetobacteraceae bacterium]|nr:cupin domain-containing protein [Acetobacteraceae bacterium]